MSLRNNMLFFYFPHYSKFLISPFCLCPLKTLVQQIPPKRWQLRSLALACPCTAHPEARGTNSLSVPIKSLASPWRLLRGCQLMSIVTVVGVAGTAAHEGLSRDAQQPCLWCSEMISQVRKQHWLITNFIHCWHRSCSSARGKDSAAQLSSPVIFSSFHDVSVAAGLIFCIFFLAN